MGLLDNALFGTPQNHDQDKQDKAVAPVQAPEFDVTQYAKKLAIVIGVLAPAIIRRSAGMALSRQGQGLPRLR